jgi:hypothetical protein
MQVQKVEFDEADDVEAMLEKKLVNLGLQFVCGLAESLKLQYLY